MILYFAGIRSENIIFMGKLPSYVLMTYADIKLATNQVKPFRLLHKARKRSKGNGKGQS